MTLFCYMLFVAATLIGWAAVFTGWGLLFMSRFGPDEPEMRDLVLLPLLGWCLTIPVLLIWHFFLRVDLLTALIVASGGVLGWGLQARRLLSWAHPRRGRWMAFAGLIFLAALWLASNGVKQPASYDSGLYHLNAIRWANTYPAVPGLANLHNRFGFNSSFVLYAAMLNTGLFAGKCHQLANGVLFLMSFVPCLWGVWRLFRRDVSTGAGPIYYAFFTVPLAVWAMHPNHASSPSMDAAGFLLGMAVGHELLALLNPQKPISARVDAYRLTVLAILALAAITVKISFVAYGGAAILVAHAVLWASPDGSRTIRRRTSVVVFLALLFLVPWMVRSVVLSGHVLFPLTWSGLPVEWKTHPHITAETAAWIKSWARQPHVHYQQVLASWNWLDPWLFNVHYYYGVDIVLPVCLAFIGVVILLMWRLCGGAARLLPYGLFMVAPMAGLLFWFFMAPATRFAGALFWVPAVGTWALILSPVRRPAIRLGALLIFSIVIIGMRNPEVLRPAYPWDTGPARTVPLRTVATHSGLLIYVPAEEDADQCWDGPLPCANKVYPHLRLRDPADLRKGFVLPIVEIEP